MGRSGRLIGTTRPAWGHSFHAQETQQRRRLPAAARRLEREGSAREVGRGQSGVDVAFPADGGGVAQAVGDDLNDGRDLGLGARLRLDRGLRKKSRGLEGGLYEMNIRALRNTYSVKYGSASWDNAVANVFGVWMNPVGGIVDDPGQREELARALNAHLVDGPEKLAERVQTIATMVPPLEEQTARLERIEKLAAIWRSLRRQDVFPITWRTLVGFIRRRDFLVAADGVRRLIDTHVPYRNLEGAKIPLHVVATDLLSGETVVLSKGPVAQAIVASTAIPVAFAPVRLENFYLADGAITCNTPVRVAVARGARRLVVLPTGYACALETRKALE